MYAYFQPKVDGVCALSEVGVVVCVEKANAVWATEHIVRPFAKDGFRERLKCKSQ